MRLLYCSFVKMIPEADDSSEFIEVVDRVVRDLLRVEVPDRLVLIKVDNFFGSRWLNFSGKVLGLLGRWSTGRALAMPPFVPSRIVWQRNLCGPSYEEEVTPTSAFHRSVPSDTARTRKVSEIASGAAILWFSGNSINNRRGCIMAYIPTEEAYEPWYASWSQEEAWVLVKAINIKREILNVN